MKTKPILFSVMLVLILLSSSWAQFPCDPLDSAVACCGASGDWKRHDTLFSKDIGICDTFHVVPWPRTDTCFIGCDFQGQCDTICINNPGEHFPCFLNVTLLVTHDSNTFYSERLSHWAQDSITAFVIPLSFWLPHEGCADSVVLRDWDAWNNTALNPYDPRTGKSIFRHLHSEGDTFTADGDTLVDTLGNRMFWLASQLQGLEWSTIILDVDSDCSEGDSGHAWLTMLTTTNRRWWEGSRVLVATLTFIVYKSEPCDTARICFDSTLLPPSSHLTFARYDSRLYFPRSNLPICLRVYDDTVEVVPTDVRWIEGSAEGDGRPTGFSISQNYPNPFNPVTEFKLSLPRASYVRMEIFNVLGQKVRTLVDEDLGAGGFVVTWDGKDQGGAEVSSGIYFYRMTAGEFSDVGKMVLLK